ncbi:DNA helicase IV, partial [Salmonella enterica subsp. enterica serovar Hvittingfoss str. A4-620]
RKQYTPQLRARARVWLLFNKDNPSRFVEALKQLEVPVARKP